MVRDHIIRALGQAFHPPCFTCVACARCIGDESFALDGQNEVYCLDDFYRYELHACLGQRGGQGGTRVEQKAQSQNLLFCAPDAGLCTCWHLPCAGLRTVVTASDPPNCAAGTRRVPIYQIWKPRQQQPWGSPSPGPWSWTGPKGHKCPRASVPAPKLSPSVASNRCVHLKRKRAKQRKGSRGYNWKPVRG